MLFTSSFASTVQDKTVFSCVVQMQTTTLVLVFKEYMVWLNRVTSTYARRFRFMRDSLSVTGRRGFWLYLPARDFCVLSVQRNNERKKESTRKED